MKERFARVMSRMERFRLTRLDPGHFGMDAEWSLEDDDVARTLVEHRPPPLLFGKFPADRVMTDLERWGLLERCRKLGYTDMHPQFSGQDLFETRFCLMAAHPDVEGPCRLMDIRTHQGELSADSPFDDKEFRVRALILDWISMEDPAHLIPDNQLPLPGQKHPGLSLFRKAYRLSLGYLRKTDFDVVVNIPEYFHNAVLYSRDFKFFMPEREGRFLAMKRDLMANGLARVSQALSPDDRDGEEPRARTTDRIELVEQANLVQWTPAEQILALSPALKDYIYDPRYQKAVAEARDHSHYQLVSRLRS